MKKRNKITLILLCLILVASTASTAGVLIWKKTAEKTPVSEEVLIDGGKASVSDEVTLRELLLKEEELEITLTEDITVDESLIVNGKKTLSGTGSIAMALYVMPYENLITVAENASLILDGLTVNGNGIANGVKVEKTANLTLLSGEVAWGNPYGIEVQGSAEIKGGTITDAIHTGIFIGTSGNVQMSSGNVKGAGYASTRISKGGYLCFSGDAILQNCGVYNIHNAGTCDVTGGVVRDSEYTLATTEGDLNIHYQGTDGGMIEWYNATGSGIWVGEGGNLNASGFYVHDIGYAGVNSGQGTGAINLTNCKFENTGNNGLHIKMATAELKDIEIIKPGKHGVFVNSPTTTATIENLTVTEPAERGLHNAGAKTTAKNVTVISPGTYGVSTGSSGDTAGSLIVENLTVTEAGSNPENSQPAVNCYKSSLTVIGATLTESNNAGARVTDGGELTLKNVKIENAESYGIYVVHNKSKATLENVSVSNTGKHGVYVNNGGAKADISKLTVTNAGERGIHNNGGTITAKNVTINGSGLYGVSTGSHTDSKTGKSTAGSVTINNLTVTGAKGDAAVNSYKSVLTITNGKITDSAKVGARVTDGGTLKLTDVEITKTGYEGVLVSSEGKATIKNITVTNAGKHGVYAYKEGSTIDIDTLTVVAPKERGVHNAGGVITAKNVTITSPGTYGVSTGNSGDSKGSVTVTNLTVTNAGANPVVNTDGSKTIQPAVNSYNSVLTVVDAKLLDSNGVGARATDGGELNLTNVEIKKTGQDGIYASKQAQINISGINTITDAGKDGICANGAGTVVNINTQKGATAKTDAITITTPVQRGIRNEGATITAANVTVTNPGTYGVSTAKSGESAGSVVVDNLKVTGAGQTEKQPAVNAHNGSVMTVNGATISDCKQVGARVTHGATMNLNDVTMKNLQSYGVFVNGDDVGGATANLVRVTIDNSGSHAVYANGEDKEATLYLTEVNITNPGFHGVFVDGSQAKAYATDLTITTTKTYELEVTPEYGDIRVSAGAYAEMEKISITGSKEHGIYVNSNSELNLTGINNIDSTGAHGIFANGANAKININMQEGAAGETDYLTVTKAGQRGIHNAAGTIEAKNVTVDSSGNYGVSTGYTGAGKGSVTITNLTVTGAATTTKNPAVNSYGSVLTITDATIEGAKQVGARVTDGGTLNLTNVDIKNSASYGIYINHANSVANVSDVKVEGGNNSEYGSIYVFGGGKLNLSGESSITNAKKAGIYVAVNSTTIINASQNENTKEYTGLDKATNNLTITGGERGIYNVGGSVTAYYVSVTDTSSYGVQSEYSGDIKGSAVVNDLSVSGAKGTASIYSKGSDLTVVDGTLKNSKGHGVLVNYGGKLTLIDSMIDGTASGKNGIHLDGDSGTSKAYLTNVTIRDAKQFGVHAYGKDGYIEIDGLKVVKSDEAEYSSLRGIANKGATIVASDVEIDYGKEYSISSYAYIEDEVLISKGEMTIDNLKITNSVRDSIHVNNCTVTINGATLTGYSRYGAVVFTGGVLNLNDAQINASDTDAEEQYGIFLEGKNSTVNLNGTSSIANAKDAGIYVQNKTIANINQTSGTLTITNCKHGIYNTSGTVTAKNVVIDTTSAEAVLVEAGGTLNLSGISSITNAGKHGVYAYGADAVININVQEGATKDTDKLTITTPKERGIHNAGGTISAANVTVNNPGTYGVSTGNYVDEETKISTAGSVTVTNLTVIGAGAITSQPAVNSYKSVLTVNGALIENSKNAGARVTDGGTLNLNDVEIRNADGYGNYGVYANHSGSTANINGLTINKVSANNGIHVTGGAVLNLKGISEINNTSGHGIYVAVNSTANINCELDKTTGEYVGLDKAKNYLTITNPNQGIKTDGGTIRAYHLTIDNSSSYGIAIYSGNKQTVRGYADIHDLLAKNVQGNASVYANNSDLYVTDSTIRDSKKDGVWALNENSYGPGKIWLTNVTINGVGRYGVNAQGTNSVIYSKSTEFLNIDASHNNDGFTEELTIKEQSGGKVEEL